MQYFEEKLNKANWRRLQALNIIDGEGNGFARTTKEFEKLVGTLSKNLKIIRVKNTYYGVQYVSGCFYPVWSKVLFSGLSTREYYNIKLVNNKLTSEFIVEN